MAAPTMRLWNLTTYQQYGKPLTGHTDWADAPWTTTLAGRPLAVAGDKDGTVGIWDLAKREQMDHELVFPAQVTALVTSDNSLAIGDDREI